MSFSKSNSIKLIYLFLLLAITAWILYHFINLSLVYHNQQPIFFTDFNTFKKALLVPGGLTDYLGSFFSVLYYYPLLGSVLTALIVSLLPVTLYMQLRKDTNSTITIILIAAVWIFSLIAFTDYSFKQSTLWVLIASSLFLSSGQLVLKKVKNSLVQVALLLVVLFMSFMITGGPGLLLTSSLFVIFKLGQTKVTMGQKLMVIAPIVLFVAFLPFVSIKIIYQISSIEDIYLGDFLNDSYYTNPKAIYLLLACLPLTIICQTINSRIKLPEYGIADYAVYIISIAILYFLPTEFIKDDFQKKIKIDYYAYQGMWVELLAEANDQVLDDYVVDFQVNRAIYHQGNMLDNICTVPQKFGAKALLVEHSVNNRILIPSSDIYFDMGLINESRHWAHEAYTRYGKQPRILKRLVQTNIINQKYNTARKYILLLKKTLLHKEWATEQEKLLYNEAAIAQNALYSEKRKQLVTTDFFVTNSNPKNNLLNYSKQPGTHKMAFEYLISYYLLTHDAGHIVNAIPEFRKYGYPELPRLVQESILIYLVQTQQQEINLSGYSISKDIVSEFSDFTQTLVKARSSIPDKRTLDKKYSNTFWYYLQFKSPITLYGAK